jgi:hypothetical protein
MKEFVEKLIGRLEEYERKSYNTYCEHGLRTDLGRSFGSKEIIQIVNQLAEEYKQCTLCYLQSPCEYQNETVIVPNNNGWIPVSERLPELTEGTECFKQSPCCLTTLKWWDGDMTESIGWYNQSGVWNEDSKNCKVIAWMPLPAPYQKGSDV